MPWNKANVPPSPEARLVVSPSVPTTGVNAAARTFVGAKAQTNEDLVAFTKG